MRNSLALVTFVLMAFWNGELFGQTPAEQFEAAREAFSYQEWDKVIAILEPLLNPEPAFTSAEMVIQAREWLGSARWWNGDKSGFNQEFTRILQARPDFELDSFYYPPEMVNDFIELKKKLKAAKLLQYEPPVKVVREIVERDYSVHSPVVNFMPFGGGQFANGSLGKGFLFLTAQVGCLAVNMGSWYYMYTASPRGGERTTALALMYGSLAALGGVYVWSVIDSFESYQPRRLLKEKHLEIPEQSVSIGGITPPLVGGSGVGLGWVISF